jgi:transposase-like protein
VEGFSVKKRKRYSAEFKFRTALEATRGQKTVSQLAGENEVHPNQIGEWKRHLLKEGEKIFARGASGGKRKPVGEEKDLYEQIGRLKMELEWLKKKVARYA